MITLQDVIDLCKQFFTDYKDADPGWSSYSKTLKTQFPGKTQIRTAFIENLGEMLILCDDPTVEKKIEGILKKYR